MRTGTVLWNQESWLLGNSDIRSPPLFQTHRSTYTAIVIAVDEHCSSLIKGRLRQDIEQGAKLYLSSDMSKCKLSSKYGLDFNPLVRRYSTNQGEPAHSKWLDGLDQHRGTCFRGLETPGRIIQKGYLPKPSYHLLLSEERAILLAY